MDGAAVAVRVSLRAAAGAFTSQLPKGVPKQAEQHLRSAVPGVVTAAVHEGVPVLHAALGGDFVPISVAEPSLVPGLTGWGVAVLAADERGNVAVVGMRGAQFLAACTGFGADV